MDGILDMLFGRGRRFQDVNFREELNFAQQRNLQTNIVNFRKIDSLDAILKKGTFLVLQTYIHSECV